MKSQVAKVVLRERDVRGEGHCIDHVTGGILPYWGRTLCKAKEKIPLELANLKFQQFPARSLPFSYGRNIPSSNLSFLLENSTKGNYLTIVTKDSKFRIDANIVITKTRSSLFDCEVNITKNPK